MPRGIYELTPSGWGLALILNGGLFVISGRSVKQLVGLARHRGVSCGVMPAH
jgi:hypothetical protein